MSDDREHAWPAVHDAVARLPAWGVGPCQYHADDELWHVTAVDLAPRDRRARREAIEATGPTEVAALDALVEILGSRASQR